MAFGSTHTRLHRECEQHLIHLHVRKPVPSGLRLFLLRFLFCLALSSFFGSGLFSLLPLLHLLQLLGLSLLLLFLLLLLRVLCLSLGFRQIVDATGNAFMGAPSGSSTCPQENTQSFRLFENQPCMDKTYWQPQPLHELPCRLASACFFFASSSALRFAASSARAFSASSFFFTSSGGWGALGWDGWDGAVWGGGGSLDGWDGAVWGPGDGVMELGWRINLENKPPLTLEQYGSTFVSHP